MTKDIEDFKNTISQANLSRGQVAQFAIQELTELFNKVGKQEEIIAWHYENEKKIQDLVDIQCRDGNWNYSSYMHGMANGMICALAILKGEEPVYLEAPPKWLCDAPRIDQPVVQSEQVSDETKESDGSNAE